MSRRRAVRLSAIALAATVVVALVAVVAVAGTVVRRPLPQHSGSLAVAGLEAEVNVLRDDRGVPQIYADTAHDLFLAQGFVHAQDRFFEMDYRRHVTAGRLSELVGADPAALAADRVIRTLGWRHVAEQEWDLLEPETQAHLEAYAEGVNAYIEDRPLDALGVEYAVLATQVELDEPEPWDPVDSLAWLKAMAWDLRSNYSSELARALIYGTVRDIGRVDELFPEYPYDAHLPIVPQEAPTETVAATGTGTDAMLLAPELRRALAGVEEALAAVPSLLGEGEGIGSNSWVVSGEHTASGAPLLANDPHLAISAPGVFTQVGLHCREVSDACPFEVAGFSFAGFPGVIIGHNADLAWGITNMGADVTDFFLERTNRQDGTWLRDGTAVPLDVRTEIIEVNGGEPVELEVRATAHGPIVSDVLTEVARTSASPMPDGVRRSTEVSLAWTALQPGRTADAVFAFATARDAADVAAAAALFEVPAQNIVFATTAGQIGYQAPGRIPVRARVVDGPVPSDGSWPRPGWDSRYDWQGWVAPEEMPAVVDPEQGFVVAANQAVTGAGVGPFLTGDWDRGFRAQRIRTLLEQAIAEEVPVDVELAGQMQLDAANPYAEVLVPQLLGTPVADDFTREGVDLLRGWDRRNDADSAAAAYFAAVWSTLLELTFWDDLPESQWPDGGSRWLGVVAELLDDPSNPWWDDRRTVNVVESRDEILSRALESARLRLTVDLGKNADEWRWGAVHVAAPEHPVLGGEDVPDPVRRLVNPTPQGVSGGSSIVNATSWDAASGSFAVTAGPVIRMVVDLGDLDASTWVTMTGTSGHPGSVHYTNQFGTWAAGETFGWPFSREAVEEASGHVLRLRPAG